MVARLTRLLLVLQFAVVLLAAGVIHYFGGVSFFFAFLTALTALALIRLGIVTNNFLMCWWFSADDLPPMAWHRWLRMVFREYRASLYTSSWAMPFPGRSAANFKAGTSLPVLLLHGYGCNSGYWRSMREALRQAGIAHATVDLEPVFADIGAYQERVDHAVRELVARSKSGRVVILAHSMGGLVSRAYLRSHGSERIARVITLGTPHHGTVLAQFSPGDNCKQMRRSDCKTRSCDWLEDLAASETAATRKLITSIYSRHDNIVVPPSSSMLEGAENIAFDGIGHVELAGRREIHDLVVTLTKDAERSVTTRAGAVLTGDTAIAGR
jgi:triacylglycerol lipase